MSTGSTFTSSTGEGGTGHHDPHHAGTNGNAHAHAHAPTIRHSLPQISSSPEEGPSPPTAPPPDPAPTHPAHHSSSNEDDTKRDGEGGGEHPPSRPTSTSNNSSIDPFGDKGGQVMAMPGEIARQLHGAGTQVDGSEGSVGSRDGAGAGWQDRGGGENSGPGSNASMVVVSGQYCPSLPNGLTEQAAQPALAPGDVRGVPRGGRPREGGERPAAPAPANSPSSTLPLPSPAHTTEGHSISTSPAEVAGSPRWSAFSSYVPPWVSASFRRISGFGPSESQPQAPSPPTTNDSNARAAHAASAPQPPTAPAALGAPGAIATIGSSSSAHASRPSPHSAAQGGLASPVTSPDQSRTQPSSSISVGPGRLGSAPLSGSGGFARFRGGASPQPQPTGRTSLAFEEVSDEEEQLTAATQATTIEPPSPPPSARTSIANSEQRAPASPFSSHQSKDAFDTLPQQQHQQQQHQPSVHLSRPTSPGSPHAPPHLHHKPGTLSTIHEIVPAGSGQVSSGSASPALLRPHQGSTSGPLPNSPSLTRHVVRARSGADEEGGVPLSPLSRLSPAGPPSSGFVFPEVHNGSAGASTSSLGGLGVQTKGTKTHKQLHVDIPTEQGVSNTCGLTTSPNHDNVRRLQHSPPFQVRDASGAVGNTSKGRSSRPRSAVQSRRFGRRSLPSAAADGEDRDGDAAAAEDGHASASKGDHPATRRHNHSRKPKKGLRKEDVAAKVSRESNKLADQNRERVQSGLKWCKYGITKFLSKGSRRSIMLSQSKSRRHRDGQMPNSARENEEINEKIRREQAEGDLCPRTIFLGINNTIKEENDSICQVAIFSPLWVDNRTGFDLIFRDLDVPSAFNDLPFLIHHPVRAPGLIRDAICIDPLSSQQGSSTSPHTGRSPQDNPGKLLSSGALPCGRARSPKDRHASSVQPALLNDQSKTTFRLQDSVGNTGWCESFKVSNSGKRFEITLKGSETTNISTVKRMNKAFGKLPRQLMQRANLLPVASLPQSPSAYRDLDEAAQQAAEELEKSEEASHGGYSTPGAGSEVDSSVHAPSASPEASARSMFVGNVPHSAFDEEGAEEKRPEDADVVEVSVEHRIQRLYHFAVEIWPGPAESVFNQTKVVTVKNKYIILNDTGLTIEYKQKGTPDPGSKTYEEYGKGRRFAGDLPHSARTAFHWDNKFLAQELVIRPLGKGWHWSGSFQLQEEEKYFGLRIRRLSGEYVIIPVNITVGSAGSVLVTLKSEKSTPPYMILNRCKDVVIRMCQLGVELHPGSKTFGGGLGGHMKGFDPQNREQVSWQGWDEVAPNAHAPMPFAWDQPMGPHVVQAVAHASGADMQQIGQQAATQIHLDEIADNVKVLHVQQPSLAGSASMPVRSNSSGALEPTQAADTRNNLRNFIFKQQKKLMEAGKSEASHMIVRARSMHETMLSAKDRLRHSGLPEGAGASSKDALLGSSKDMATPVAGPSATAGSQNTGLTLEDRGRMERMARVLARECAKKVYVSIYAEGPMRVLCFAEEKTSITSVDDVNSVLNMAIRLQHVSSKVAEVDEELSKHLSITERTAQMDLRKAATKLALSDPQGPHSRGFMQAGPSESKPSASLSLQPSDSLTPSMQRSSMRAFPPAGAGGVGPGAASNWAKLRQHHLSTLSPSRQQQPRSYGLALGDSLFARTGSISSGAAAQTPALRGILRPQATTSLPATGSPGSSFTQPSAPAPSWEGSPAGAAGGVPADTAARPLGFSLAPDGALNPVVATEDGRGLPHQVQPQTPSLITPATPGHDASLPGTSGMAQGSNLRPMQSIPQPGLYQPSQRPAALPARAPEPQPPAIMLSYPNGMEVPIGGDLKVRIISARGLRNLDRLQHVYAKAMVRDQVTMTNMVMSSKEPEWRFEDVFRDVPASAELTIEVWGIPRYKEKKLFTNISKLSEKAREVGDKGLGAGSHSRVEDKAVARSRGSKAEMPDYTAADKARGIDVSGHTDISAGAVFLGCAEMPLLDSLQLSNQVRTLTLDEPLWLPLLRREGQQAVRGDIQFALEWQFTREGLLLKEVELLERLLAEKVELLARLKPVEVDVTQHWLRLPALLQGSKAHHGHGARSSGFFEDAEEAEKPGVPSPEEESRMGSSVNGEEDEEEDSMPDVNAQQISNSYFVNLDVSVLEVRNLSTRSGWRQDLLSTLGGMQGNNTNHQQRTLPNVQVSVSCFERTHVVDADAPSVNPRFARNGHRFEMVALSNIVHIKVMDKVGLLRTRCVTLGETDLLVGSIPSANPIYVWVPLWKLRRGQLVSPNMLQAGRRGRRRYRGITAAEAGAFGPDGPGSSIAVMLRLQITKPPASGVRLGLTLDLAGVGLTAKSSVHELLNITIQRVRCSMLRTARELQIAMSVDSFQLDNQMLETQRPVVISPTDVSNGANQMRRYIPDAGRMESMRLNHQSLLRTISSSCDRPLVSLHIVRSYAATPQWAQPQPQQQQQQQHQQQQQQEVQGRKVKTNLRRLSARSLQHAAHQGQQSAAKNSQYSRRSHHGGASYEKAAGPPELTRQAMTYSKSGRLLAARTAVKSASGAKEEAAAQEQDGGNSDSNANHPGLRRSVTASTSNAPPALQRPSPQPLTHPSNKSRSARERGPSQRRSSRRSSGSNGGSDLEIDAIAAQAAAARKQSLKGRKSVGFAVPDSVKKRSSLDAVAEEDAEAEPKNSTGAVSGATIVSFKKLVVAIGPLDFVSDQHFLEAVYMFIQSLPMADVHQDAKWQEDMERSQGLHSTQLYPSSAPTPRMGEPGTRSLSHLASSKSMGVTPGPQPSPGAEPPWSTQAPPDQRRERQGSRGRAGGKNRNRADAHIDRNTALQWLMDKEDQELNVMRGQSSSWFFIEELNIGMLSVNVTLSLDSNVNFSGGTVPREVNEEGGQRTVLKGVLTRLSGSSGFQLINVSNAPIVLEGKMWTNLLVNKVGLINLLWRHYSWPAMTETRKVLGGAGPAIAAVPASILWAGISMVELFRDVFTKRAHPSQLLPRSGFYGFTAIGQIVGTLSRVMGTIMTVLPVQREGFLSDNDAMRRFTRRPNTIVDSIMSGQKDVVLGFLAAIAGPVLDPLEGIRTREGFLAVLCFTVGIFKSLLGLGLRPAAGIVEVNSKFLQGIGLLCLGKKGIQGKMLRRVCAPGTPMQNSIGGTGVDMAAAMEDRVKQEQIMAAWQGALGAIAPCMAQDTVLDVLAARPSRVVLLTDRHVAYLFVKHHSSTAASTSTTMPSKQATTYKLKWYIPNHLVDNVRGVERTYRVSIEYRHPLNVGSGKTLKLPLRKGMRTDDSESHQALIHRLNRHIGKDHKAAGKQMRLISQHQTHRHGGSAIEDLTIALAPPPSSQPQPLPTAPRTIAAPGAAAAGSPGARGDGVVVPPTANVIASQQHLRAAPGNPGTRTRAGNTSRAAASMGSLSSLRGFGGVEAMGDATSRRAAHHSSSGGLNRGFLGRDSDGRGYARPPASGAGTYRTLASVGKISGASRAEGPAGLGLQLPARAPRNSRESEISPA